MASPLYCLAMLTTLRVKNLAIVDNIRVDFSEGLNVITGETGAGKSILADALGLVLGDRADRSMIRTGEEQCGVEACFELSDPSEINAVLDEVGLEACDGNTLIVRRLFGSRLAFSCVAIYGVLPLGLFYSRAIHIDFAAVFCAHALVYHSMRAYDEGSWPMSSSSSISMWFTTTTRSHFLP